MNRMLLALVKAFGAAVAAGAAEEAEAAVADRRISVDAALLVANII